MFQPPSILRISNITNAESAFRILLFIFVLVTAVYSQDVFPADSSSTQNNITVAATRNTADIILTNGSIYTVDEENPLAEAIAIRNDRIIAVTTSAGIKKYQGPATQIIDLDGRFVLPGFIDSHAHFMLGGKYLSHIRLRDATTMAEVQKRVAEYARTHRDKKWIIGDGFSYGYPDLPKGEFHHEMLDRIVSDRPVYLTSPMAHAAWVNKKALELAGITRDTPDPVGGEIVRETNGIPTGWLKESAWFLPAAAMPEPANEEELNWLKAAIREANRLGVTRLVSAGFDLPYVGRLDEIRKTGDLSLRFSISALVDKTTDLSEEWFQTLETTRARYRDNFISVAAVKFIMDGVIESHTGYLPGGYADNPRETGMVFWEQEAFNRIVLELHQRNFQVFAHAIGDGAIARALDAYEAARTVVARPLRHRIEHVEAPYPEDVPRFKELDVIASMQPLMIYPRDEWIGMEGIWARYAGEKYLPVYFALRSLLDAGAVVAFGTDWPVVQLNPMLGLRNAVLRQSLDGQPKSGYVPEQRITVAEAIRAYTLDAAYAIHREQDEGSITAGKLADLVVLSNNLLEINPDEIAEVKVELTMVGGDIVYRRSD